MSSFVRCFLYSTPVKTSCKRMTFVHWPYSALLGGRTSSSRISSFVLRSSGNHMLTYWCVSLIFVCRFITAGKYFFSMNESHNLSFT